MNTTAIPCVAVLSAKGGCGRSTVAINLAYLLAAGGKQVALVDLAQFGSLAMLLWVQSAAGLGPVATCLRSSHREEMADVLQASLTPVRLGDHCVSLLSAAPPHRQDDLEADDVVQVVHTLQGLGYAVVLDTSHELSDRLAGALHAASHQLWVLSTDPAAGWHLHQARNLARQLGAPDAPAGVLVNRQHRHSGLRLPELKAACGVDLWGVLPDLPRQLPVLAQLGVPLLAQRRGPWQRTLRAVLQHVSPGVAAASGRRFGAGRARHAQG